MFHLKKSFSKPSEVVQSESFKISFLVAPIAKAHQVEYKLQLKLVSKVQAQCVLCSSIEFRVHFKFQFKYAFIKSQVSEYTKIIV